MKHTHTPKPQTTSWDPVNKWYQTIVGEEGHYYHQQVILPNLLKTMNLQPQDSIIDFACGPGVLARKIPKGTKYLGVDISPGLIKAAKDQDKTGDHHFIVGDVTNNLSFDKQDYTHAAIILALQNVEKPEQAIKNAWNHLKKGGRFFIVLNHPCFRIPRQSSWGVDESKKIQYRRIDRYMQPLQIPINMTPGAKGAPKATLSFHHPLSSYTKWLYDAGFLIETIDEWCSDKVSTGSKAKMENRSREEFPLFMLISAKKV